jgi:hypothetical protein
LCSVVPKRERIVSPRRCAAIRPGVVVVVVVRVAGKKTPQKLLCRGIASSSSTRRPRDAFNTTTTARLNVFFELEKSEEKFVTEKAPLNKTEKTRREREKERESVEKKKKKKKKKKKEEEILARSTCRIGTSLPRTRRPVMMMMMMMMMTMKR